MANGITFGGMIKIISINDIVEFERIFFELFMQSCGQSDTYKSAPLCKYSAHNKVIENQYAAILT